MEIDKSELFLGLAFAGWWLATIATVNWFHAAMRAKDHERWESNWENTAEHWQERLVEALEDAARTKPAATERQEPRD